MCSVCGCQWCTPLYMPKCWTFFAEMSRILAIFALFAKILLSDPVLGLPRLPFWGPDHEKGAQTSVFGGFEVVASGVPLSWVMT